MCLCTRLTRIGSFNTGRSQLTFVIAQWVWDEQFSFYTFCLRGRSYGAFYDAIAAFRELLKDRPRNTTYYNTVWATSLHLETNLARSDRYYGIQELDQVQSMPNMSFLFEPTTSSRRKRRFDKHDKSFCVLPVVWNLGKLQHNCHVDQQSRMPCSS